MSFLRHWLSNVRADAVTHLSTGGIAIDAVLSRSGVLEYETPDGTVREFRAPAAVLSLQAIATLQGATVTAGADHPKERRITTDNYRKYVVGHVASVRIDGDKLVGTLHIHDAQAIEWIASGKLGDLSPGYIVDLDDTPGSDDEYGDYDALTTSMRYNHITLLPKGAGRQPGVGLRLDAAGQPVIPFDTPTEESSDMDLEMLKAALAEMLPEMIEAHLQAKVDEVDVSVEDEPKEDADKSKDFAEESKKPFSKKEALEEKEDSEDEELSLDSDESLEDRLDARLLEVVRTVERATGKPADLSLSPRALLTQAAEARGVAVRADSSTDRLLGALEVVGRPTTGITTETVEAPTPELTADDYNRRIAKRRGAQE